MPILNSKLDIYTIKLMRREEEILHMLVQLVENNQLRQFRVRPDGSGTIEIFFPGPGGDQHPRLDPSENAPPELSTCRSLFQLGFIHHTIPDDVPGRGANQDYSLVVLPAAHEWVAYKLLSPIEQRREIYKLKFRDALPYILAGLSVVISLAALFKP